MTERSNVTHHNTDDVRTTSQREQNDKYRKQPAAPAGAPPRFSMGTGGPERTEVPNSPEFTGGRPGVVTPIRSDTYRRDLSHKLVEIRSYDGVRFVFNDMVDRRTLHVQGSAEGPGNTLSIRSVADLDGTAASEPVQASRSHGHWVENRAGRIDGFGQYAWESDRALIVGPPEGGWPQGRYVRFEFDRSLSDDAGNPLVDNRDQIVIASVRTEVVCTIDEPTLDHTFLRWESEDAILGRREDFAVLVAGSVVQKGATEHVRRVIVTATSNKGLVVQYDIFAGDIERQELRHGLGSSDWLPNKHHGGKWIILLPLQSQDWHARGCQAVVEGHDTWTITAAIETAAGIQIESASQKVVHHELCKSRVITIHCPQIAENNGLFYHWHHERTVINRLRFTRSDLGLKQFVVRLDGDFERDTVFSYVNTYVSENTSHQILHWERVYDSELQREVTEIHLPGFNIHERVNDYTASGEYRNRTVHTFSISIKTRAGFAIYFSFEFFADTIPLDLENVESVQMNFAGNERSVGGVAISDMEEYEVDHTDWWRKYTGFRSIGNKGATSATTISYESTSEIETRSTTRVEETVDWTSKREQEAHDRYVEIIGVDLPPYYAEGDGTSYGEWSRVGEEVVITGWLLKQWRGNILPFPALYDQHTNLLHYLRGDLAEIAEGELVEVRGVVFGEVHGAGGIDITDMSLGNANSESRDERTSDTEDEQL